MNSSNSIYKRIIEYLLSIGMDKDEIAKKAGLSGRRMIDYTLDGKIKQISRKSINILAQNIGMSEDELLSRAMAFNREEQGPSIDDFVFVPRLAAHPKCGMGSEEVDADITGWFAFQRRWIESRGILKNMRLFTVVGDSMEETLHDGDMILVNTAQKEPRTGLIYLVRVGTELAVKRVSVKPKGIELMSDNPRYDPIFLDKNNEDLEIQFYGRMIWSCREH